MTRVTTVDSALAELKRLLRGGRVLLLLAAVVTLAFLVMVLLPFVGKTPHLDSLLVIVDYVLVLGVAGPGLTLYLLYSYSSRELRRGNWIVISRKAKIALISFNWVALAAVLALIR